MRFALDELSVAPIQSLYACRLLKEPSSFLNPVYRNDFSNLLEIGEGVTTDEVDSYGRVVYRLPVDVAPKHIDKVPMLEFAGPDSALKLLQDIVGVEAGNSLSFLVAGHATWDPDLQVRCYWCPTFHDVQDAMEEFQKELAELRDALDSLITAVETSGPITATLKDAVADNLIKTVGTNAIGSTTYRIEELKASTQNLPSPTQEVIDRLPKQVVGQLRLTQLIPSLSLSQFTGGEIVVSGSGDLYLYNVTSKVTLDNFTGNLYALQCPNIYIIRGAYLQNVSLVHSSIEMYSGSINELYLARRSSCHHMGGRVSSVSHVGVACNYTSSIPSIEASMNEPRTVNLREIQGLYTSYSGEVIKNGKNIAFQRGTVDSPLPSTELICIQEVDVIPPTGEGVEPIPPVTDGMAIPSTHYDICTEDYRTIAFTQAFMLTSAPPQTIADITSETFHTLRALWAWCMEEFGPSVYGQSFSKLIRTMALYPLKNAYRGKGKTLKDLVLDLRVDVISWGGWDIWNVSYEWVKAQVYVTDEQVLEFMQYLYKNIRYPELFGVDDQTDPDVIKAMSGMPIMNQTISDTNHNIPSGNYPLVWYVQKQVTWFWYVIYRPVSYNTSIDLGPNAAVL